MDIETLANMYRNRIATPTEVVQSIYQQIRLNGLRPIWISLVDFEQNLKRAAELEDRARWDDLPLFGIPFAVKDNFDVVGLSTTAACPEFAYWPVENAQAVVNLLRAGAILIGKTNMDQFATGLVGTRTPYGVCSSVFDAQYISGGSSSGSAVAVAQELVSFSLGTDTAGSGRVPAAMNNLVGVKPTRGFVSTFGLLPACRSLDCVSIFAETCDDASKILTILGGPDSRDPYSRNKTPGEGACAWATTSFRFGVLRSEDEEFFGDQYTGELYRLSVEHLEACGGEAVAIDFGPFRRAASLLYDGPWVAERLAVLRGFVESSPASLDPTVSTIVRGAARFSAVDTFLAEESLRALITEASITWSQVDLLLLPTIPTIYKIQEVLDSPVELNSNLGYYTNFVNLMDLAAIAVPAGSRPDGLPFSVSLIGRAFTDSALIALGDKLHRRMNKKLGGSSRSLSQTPRVSHHRESYGCVLIAVVGAHLTDQPLNWQLCDRKARRVERTTTTAEYKLYALPNSTPAKPALVYSPGTGGAMIVVEVWAVPEDTIGSFLQGIPAPLCLGTVRLVSGQQVKGFLCEPYGLNGATEITEYGGWEAYLSSRS